MISKNQFDLNFALFANADNAADDILVHAWDNFLESVLHPLNIIFI